MLRASVIVPYADSGRKRKTVGACLGALARQDYPDVQVLLVDSPGLSGVQAELEGLAKADGDVTLFTDCDCYVSVGWVRSHMVHYPGVDMVLGAPSRGFKWLSFRNFSVRTSLIRKMGLRDVPNHDFDLALRLLKTGGFRYQLDRTIQVVHDDIEPVPMQKMFSYAANCALLMRKYGVLPNREDFSYLTPKVLLGAVWALAMPTSSPFKYFRKKGQYAHDTEY